MKCIFFKCFLVQVHGGGLKKPTQVFQSVCKYIYLSSKYYIHSRMKYEVMSAVILVIVVIQASVTSICPGDVSTYAQPKLLNQKVSISSLF